MEKASLSEKLNDLIFERELHKREIDALKERCEGYQSDDFAAWNDEVLWAYSQYFGYLAALKMRSVLEEAKKYGYLRAQNYSVIDIGAGTLGATLGAVDFCRDHGIIIDSLTAADKDLKPVTWAKERFNAFFEKAPELTEYFPQVDPSKNTLLILSDILSENNLQTQSWDSLQNSRFGRDFVKAIRSLSPDSLVLIVEPAHKRANQKLLSLRDLVSKEMSILLPCPHSDRCPALPQDEWCHEERSFDAPIRFTQLVHKMGFARRFLQFSELVLGKQDSAFGLQHARVVSRQLKNKGRHDKWLCQAGKRFKVSEVLRRRNETNGAYFDSERGDVLDSTSTTIPAAVK